MQLGGGAGLFRTFIWSRVSGLMLFRDGSRRETASNFVQISKKCDAYAGNNYADVRGKGHEPCTESPN
jgi:hypothetical protein